MQKRILVLALLCCMLLGACAPAAVPQTAAPERPQTSGSASYTLSVDPETCCVSVLDKVGNTVLSTNPDDPQEDEFTPAASLNNLRSQLIVSYYSELNVDSTIGSYLSSVKKKTFTVTWLDDARVRIDYDFSRKDEQFIIPVEYRLEDDCFQVRVLTDEIQEYGAKRISRISVTPYLLRGSVQDSGYLLLPDGSGALIENSDTAYTLSGKMYGIDYAYHQITGQNQEVMRLPVFGAVQYTEAVAGEEIDDSIEQTKEEDLGKTDEEKTAENEALEKELGIEGSTSAEEEAAENGDNTAPGTNNPAGETPATEEPAAEEDPRVTAPAYNAGYVAIIEEGESLATLTSTHGGSVFKYS